MLTGDVIVFTRPDDGGVSVVHVNDADKKPNESQEEFYARIWRTCVPKGVTARWATAADLPADRTERDAWKDYGVKIDVDPSKAKKPKP